MGKPTTNLEERLDQAGQAWGQGAGAPAPEFLGAVRRRRTVRRIRTAGLCALVVLAVTGSVWLIRAGMRPAGPQDRREIAGNADGKKNGTLRPAPEGPPALPTIAQLSRQYRDWPTENTLRPGSDKPHRTERPMRLLDSRNPAVFEPAFNGV